MSGPTPGDPTADEELLAGQIRYYEDRAPVYEQLWFRQGTYSLGPGGDARWFAETAQVEAGLASLDASGDVLELGCGSGLWTRRLAPRARSLVAVDAAPAMLGRNRERVGGDHVAHVLADVFTWSPSTRFDLIAFGFFLSHVPPSRWESFWSRLASWLRPGGRVWFVDDAWGPDRPSTGARVAGAPPHAHRRRLGGRDYAIVKRFWRPRELTLELERLGWTPDVRGTGVHLLHGTATPLRWGWH